LRSPAASKAQGSGGKSQPSGVGRPYTPANFSAIRLRRSGKTSAKCTNSAGCSSMATTFDQ